MLLPPSRRAALLTALLLVSSARAQSAGPTVSPTANQFDVLALDLVDGIAVPAIDPSTLARDDVAREQAGLPPRFAVPTDVFADPDHKGTWEELDATTSLWRLRVTAPGAEHINLGFTTYRLPRARA